MKRRIVYCAFVAVALMFGVAQGVTEDNLVNRYSFTDGDVGAVDSVGGKDGTLEGTAVISGNQMVLDGGGTALLPSDVLDPALESVTIEAWFQIGTVSSWQRVWDFGDTSGNDGGNTFYYVATSGPGDSRLCIGTNGFPSWQTGEDIITAPIIAVDTPTHIVSVYDSAGPELRLYQDGALVASGATTMPLSGVARVNAYVGDSSYPLDPSLTGSVDEFRIWNAAFTEADALASYTGGPGVVIPEPATIALLGLGGLALLRRKR